MKDISPQSPEARRKRLASMRAAFGPRGRARSSSPRQTRIEVVKSGRRSASRPTASSTPATSPSWRCSRCSPSSSSPPRSRICSARAQDAQLTVYNVLRRLPPDVAATLREPIERSARRRGPGPCCGSARRSACGPRPASSRPSATSCAAPMASNSARRSGNIGWVDPLDPRRGVADDARLRAERGVELDPASSLRAMVPVRRRAWDAARPLSPDPGG